jgi:hypothetical protein
MRGAVAILLILIGGCLILGPVVANAYNTNREKERIAEFYSRTTNAAVLPDSMMPTGHTAYDWGCFVAGAVMAMTGVICSRTQGAVQSPINPADRR